MDADVEFGNHLQTRTRANEDFGAIDDTKIDMRTEASPFSLFRGR